jgi:DNA-binding response OmpR family regulator
MACRVIIADPSVSVQKVVQMAFAAPDFEIHPFEDGLELLQSLGRVNPDAVLVSLSLPGRDGYEVGRCLRTREEFRRTGLVLLRNAFETLDLEKLRGIDYDEIVQKPFDSEKLARTVREIVDRKKGPHSFPEESLLEDIPATGTVPLFEEAEFAPPPPPACPPIADDVEEKIRQTLQEEILSMERELEKRLKATLRSEVQSLLDREQRKKP